MKTAIFVRGGSSGGRSQSEVAASEFFKTPWSA
jgi:hypothetical protein